MKGKHFILFTLLLVGLKLNAQYVSNGSSFVTSSGCFQVTPALSNQIGSVWNATQTDLNAPFDYTYSINFGAQDGNGADGMAFVIQQSGTSQIGIGGSGLGYQGTPSSLAVEFDTYQNQSPWSDPSYDHMAIFQNGSVDHASVNNLAGPIMASSTSTNIEDNTAHLIRITWDPSSQTFACYFDCSLRLSITQDLINSVFGGNSMVYWGFTGATGGLSNLQTVCMPQSVSNIATPAAVCQGTALTLTAPMDAASAIQWQPAGIIDNPNAATIHATLTQDTTLTVTYQDLCGVPHTASTVATVLAPPAITLQPDTTVCSGTQVHITASVQGPTTFVTWLPSAGGMVLSGSSTLSPTLLGAATYTFSAINGTCFSTATFVINTLAYPTANWADSVYFCTGNSISIDPLANNTTDYLWAADGSTNSTLTVTNGGTYSVDLSNQFCTTTSSIVAFEVIPPSINLGPDQFKCIGETATITSNYTGYWNNGTLSSSISTNITSTISQSIHTLGCVSSDTMHVTIQLPPIVNLGNDTTICEGTTLPLDAGLPGTWNNSTYTQILNASQAGTYSVFVDDGVCTAVDTIHISTFHIPLDVLPDTVIHCSDVPIVLIANSNDASSYLWNTTETTGTIRPSDSGLYTLTSTNYCGTYIENIEVIYEKCAFTLYIPNSFTPNQDGINEVWYPVFDKLKAIQISIYDRWGNVVFEGDKNDYVWTGNVRNGEYFAPDGIYTYRIVYSSEFGDDAAIDGHIALFR